MITKSLLGLFTLVSLTSAAYSQIPTNATPKSFNKPVAWPAGSNVTVYVDVSSIPQGGTVWNLLAQRVAATSGAYGNGVTYSSLTPISGCSDPNTTCPLVAGPKQLFSAGSLESDEGAQNTQGFNASSPDPGPIQQELSSHVILDVSQWLTSSGTLSINFGTRVIDHELEHDYAVGDAPDADPNATIMSYQASPDNPGISIPSDADIQYGYTYSGGGGDKGYGYCTVSDDGCPARPNDN